MNEDVFYGRNRALAQYMDPEAQVLHPAHYTAIAAPCAHPVDIRLTLPPPLLPPSALQMASLPAPSHQPAGLAMAAGDTDSPLRRELEYEYSEDFLRCVCVQMRMCLITHTPLFLLPSFAHDSVADVLIGADTHHVCGTAGR